MFHLAGLICFSIYQDKFSFKISFMDLSKYKLFQILLKLQAGLMVFRNKKCIKVSASIIWKDKILCNKSGPRILNCVSKRIQIKWKSSTVIVVILYFEIVYMLFYIYVMHFKLERWSYHCVAFQHIYIYIGILS